MMEYKGKLHETVMKYPCTDIWNDSCAKNELEYAIERGAVGATTNPVIVSAVLEQELPFWKDRIEKLVQENPSDTEDDIAWKVIEMIGSERAPMLLPAFEKFNHKKGRLSMQTNPKFFCNAEKMTAQAVHFNSLGDNIQVKIPVTAAGIRAIEEATYQGVNINATVCFTLPQAIAVAEAVERGLCRREEENLPIEDMAPVCTIMIGRLDDYIKDYVKKENIIIDPEAMEWAGIAVFKKAYKIYRERGYRIRLLSAAYRNLNHWAELVGGDCAMTIPYPWQVKINECDMEVINRIDHPVAKEYIDGLVQVPAFVQGYLEDGLSVDQFENYGATRITLRSFLAGYDKLIGTIRNFKVVSFEERS